MSLWFHGNLAARHRIQNIPLFISALQLCTASTGLLEFVHGGRASTLLSDDPKQGCFYIATSSPSWSILLHQAGRTHLWSWEGNSVRDLDQADSAFAVLCPAVFPVPTSLWGSCWLTCIFRNSCPNESQNKLFNDPVGMIHRSILLFYQTIVCRQVSGCLQQKKVDEHQKRNKQLYLSKWDDNIAAAIFFAGKTDITVWSIHPSRCVTATKRCPERTVYNFMQLLLPGQSEEGPKEFILRSGFKIP